MIGVQISVSDLFRRHLRSCGVSRGTNRFLANNSRLKRARDKGLVSMWLYCHDASTDIQHDLFGSTFDLMWDSDLRSDVDLTLLWSPCIWFNAPWRKEHAGSRIKPLAFVVQKLLAKNDVGKKQLFWGLFIPSAQIFDVSSSLMTCWWEKTSQELSNVFFSPPNKMVFWANGKFSKKYQIFAKLDLWWPLVASIFTWVKNWLSSFEMIIDEVSNDNLRFVLR